MGNLLVQWAGRDRVREAAMSSASARDLVARFVAGEHLDDLVPVVGSLVDKGLLVSVEYLGQPVQQLEQAAANQQSYLEMIARLADDGLAQDAEVSVRLGWLGQELGPQGQSFALDAARRIARAATNAGAMVTIDMASADLVDSVLDIWNRLHQDLPRTGVTLQSALYRTELDLLGLAMPGTRIRLCKGAFSQARSATFRSRHEIDLAFVRGLRTLMGSQAIALVATHDPRLIAISEELIRRAGRAPGSYEFQMLHGVRPLEQRRLVDIGHATRCYVPFGPGWYDYYLSRLTERPANAALFARALFGKR